MLPRSLPNMEAASTHTYAPSSIPMFIRIFTMFLDAQADQEATEMLVGCAENLMSAVRQTVQETEAASVRIKGPSWIWTRS